MLAASILCAALASATGDAEILVGRIAALDGMRTLEEHLAGQVEDAVQLAVKERPSVGVRRIGGACSSEEDAAARWCLDGTLVALDEALVLRVVLHDVRGRIVLGTWRGAVGDADALRDAVVALVGHVLDGRMLALGPVTVRARPHDDEPVPEIAPPDDVEPPPAQVMPQRAAPRVQPVGKAAELQRSMLAMGVGVVVLAPVYALVLTTPFVLVYALLNLAIWSPWGRRLVEVAPLVLVALVVPVVVVAAALSGLGIYKAASHE